MATAVRAKHARATTSPEHKQGDCITAGTTPVCDECLDHLPDIKYERVQESRASVSKANPDPVLPDRFSLSAAITDADILYDRPAEPASPEQLDALDVVVWERELKEREALALESIDTLFDKDRCSLCGLAFPGGVRQSRAWGSPTITKGEHFNHHRAESEAREQPRDPQTGRIAVPEDHTAHFPVYVNGEVEFPTLPITAKRLERHIKKYGSEGTKGVETVDELHMQKRRPRRKRNQVLDLHDQGYTTLAISSELDLAVKVVERYLREARTGSKQAA
jgi:hypothetical protein